MKQKARQESAAEIFATGIADIGAGDLGQSVAVAEKLPGAGQASRRDNVKENRAVKGVVRRLALS